MLCIFTEKEGEYPLFQTICLHIRTAIHKQVFLSRMSMKIAKEQYVTALKCLSHHHFHCEIFWVQFGPRRDPLSIEVLPRERAAIISDNDSIRVEHWHNFENEVVPKVLCSLIITNQILESTMHYE